MKTYELNVSWLVAGTVKVVANSQEEAIKTAEGMNPTSVFDAEYVEDSWYVEDTEEVEPMD